VGIYGVKVAVLVYEMGATCLVTCEFEQLDRNRFAYRFTWRNPSSPRVLGPL